MKPALAIDFDGTVTADDVFPNIGPENYWVVMDAKNMDYDTIRSVTGDGIHTISNGKIKAPATYVIKQLSKRFEIIFHTCRTGKSQEMMKEWLLNGAFTKMHHKHDYYVNTNPHCPEAFQKPFADVYLDNRGLTWTQDINVEESIDRLMSKLPVHTYIPQSQKPV